jgi:hypothetical protein
MLNKSLFSDFGMGLGAGSGDACGEGRGQGHGKGQGQGDTGIIVGTCCMSQSFLFFCAIPINIQDFYLYISKGVIYQ